MVLISHHHGYCELSPLAGVTCRAHLNLSKPWYTQITANGKNHYLGYFASEVEAAKVFDRAARKFEGPGAILNVPGEIDEDVQEDEELVMRSGGTGMKAGPSGSSGITPAVAGELDDNGELKAT